MEQLSERVGLESLEVLRSNVQKSLLEQANGLLRDKFKKDVVEVLLGLNPIEVPEGLVEQEAQDIANAEAHGGRAHEHDHQHEHAHEILPHHRDLARKRVLTGMLLSSYVEKADLKLDNNRVTQKISEIAAMFDDEAEAFKAMLKDGRQIAQIRSLVMEEQAIEAIAAQANKTVKKITYTELMQRARESV